MKPAWITSTVVVWGLSLALIGCVNITTLPDLDKPLTDSEIVLNAWQQEIATETYMTNPMVAGGGVLGVLIVSSIDHTRHSRAEEAIGPIRDMVVETPHTRLFAEKILESSLLEGLAGSAPVEVLDVLPPAGSNAVGDVDRMEIIPTILMTNDLRSLVVRLDFHYWTLSKHRPDRRARFLQQRYEYGRPIRPSAERLTREEAQAAWLELSREELDAWIEEGMDNVMALWAYHLAVEQLPRGGQSHVIPHHPQSIFGREVLRQEDSIWLRATQRDWLYAVHKSAY